MLASSKVLQPVINVDTAMLKLETAAVAVSTSTNASDKVVMINISIVLRILPALGTGG